MLNRLIFFFKQKTAYEIYAIHGRKYKTAWLNDHFEAQPWYMPRDDFKESELSDTEDLNIGAILRRENQIHADLSAKPLTKALLAGLLVEDVKNLRLEIYARRGKVFKTKWIKGYFESFKS